MSRRENGRNRRAAGPKGGIGASGGGAPGPALDRADLAFHIDASDAGTYAHSGGTLTSLTSDVSGTPLTTITGAPKFLTDPRDNKPAFSGSATDGVRGLDATMATAATGSNRAWTQVSVIVPTAATSTGYFFCCNLSSGTHGLYYGQVSPNVRAAQAGPGGFISAASETCLAGQSIIIQRTTDGLTVYTSVNGGPESSVTVASHGLMSPDRTGVFETVGLTPGTRYNGYVKELGFYGVDKGAAWAAATHAKLLAKWRPPPVVYAVGDSITTGQLATNGGFVVQLAVSARADGLNVDMQGPIAHANGAGGEVWAPYRDSAASGNTCAQMLTRVQSATQGLGVGGGSSGFYRRARLALLFAGTNDLSVLDYTSLLDEIYTRMVQHGQPSFRIAVTTITDISGSEAAVAVFNAALPSVWDTFEAAHPGILIRWNAFLACPYSAGDFVDTTHPNSAGYLKLTNDPTNGLYQAIKPYLVSIQ